MFVLLLLLLFSASGPPATSFPADLTSNGATLTVEEHAIRVARAERTILALDAIRFNHIDAESWQLAGASDDEIVVRLTYPAAVDHHKHATDETPRAVDLSINAVAGGFRLHAAPAWGNQTTLDLAYLAAIDAAGTNARSTVEPRT